MPVRTAIKNILVKLRLPVTRNIRYDIYTRRIMQNILKPDSTGIDIGCHKGEILDDILRFAPQGKHFAFEPIPGMFQKLSEKYKGKNVLISAIALYDQKGQTEFQHVLNAPAYSGLKKREYDLPDARISKIKVDTDLLDNVIPEDQKVDFIKVDVEGAEFAVLKGGVKTIQRNKPVIIFEFGLGAADFYGSDPASIFGFLTKTCGLSVSTLKGFLNGAVSLDPERFCSHFTDRTEYYFIAYNAR